MTSPRSLTNEPFQPCCIKRKHEDIPSAVLIRTYAGSSASFNVSANWRFEGTAARNDSEMARGESNA